MAKYHISPSTGNPNKCTAVKACPFGGAEDHFESKDQAREAYETRMKSEAPAPLKKSTVPSVQYGTVTHSFTEDRLPEAKAAMEKANRRLAKFGIAEKFDYEIRTLHERVPAPIPGMPDLAEKRLVLELKTPVISYGGHRFLAVVEQEEAGLLMKTAHDVELKGWRPHSMQCEHCGQNRGRSKTYLVESEDGQRKQIGSTCVEGYLGVKPEGLWALSTDPLEKLSEAGGRIPMERLERPTDFTLALALAVSDNGDTFVSKSEAYDTGVTSTAERVEDVTWALNGVTKEMQQKYFALAARALADGSVAKLTKTLQEMEGATDYAENLRTVAASEWISPRSTAILVSGISVQNRQKRKAAKEAQPKATPGFAGAVKDKMKGRKATVTAVDHSFKYDPYSRSEVPTTRVNFRDESGHEMVWWASSRVDTEAGKEVTFTGGIVKAHKKFRDEDQTVLTRVKME